MQSFSELIRSGQPILVDFYADWCGPCRAMTPVIKEVAQALSGKAKVIKVNIDESREASEVYSVQAVPTFVLFKNGNIVWRHAGMIDKRSLLDVIRKYSDN